MSTASLQLRPVNHRLTLLLGTHRLRGGFSHLERMKETVYMANKFGELIAEKRNARGYSLRRLAALVSEEVKVSAEHLRNIEAGNVQTPGVDLVKALAKVLHIAEDEALVAAFGHAPFSPDEEMLVELAANLKSIPPDIQLILRIQIRAVHDHFAAQLSGKEGEDDKQRPIQPPPGGVKPGDEEYREPSAVTTPPPRKKKRDEDDARQDKREGRRSA
jgi:transcriptional regulator with XRE-family HTH domain